MLEALPAVALVLPAVVTWVICRRDGRMWPALLLMAVFAIAAVLLVVYASDAAPVSEKDFDAVHFAFAVLMPAAVSSLAGGVLGRLGARGR